MFISKIMAEDRSPWGDFWFQPVGLKSSLGIRVDADSAMRLSAVYSCVRVLSESFAVLPFQLFRSKVGGGRTLVTDHWLYRLFAKAPNRFQTPFEFREMLNGHVALRGNAFCEIVEDGRGGIGELMPLNPDGMKIEMLANGSYRFRYTDRTGNTQYYRRDQIWHIRGLSSDGIVGLNPIELQREAIASGIGAQDYGNRFFANDAKPMGGWVELPGRFQDQATRDEFRESWQAQHGGVNRGKVAVLENGMKYHEIGLTNKDSQFLESRQFNVTDIARIFRIPPHLINDLSKATFSNIEQQSLEFVMHTMTPWVERWESSIETFLLGPDQDLEVEFSFSVLLRGDSNARSLFYHNSILDGWMTRNEARAREGLDPLEGLDEPLRPLNTTPNSVDPDGDPSADQKPGTSKNIVPDPESADPDMDARYFSLVTAAAERVARKELNVIEAALRDTQVGQDKAVALAYAAHVKYVADCMGINELFATQYCQNRHQRFDRQISKEDFIATAVGQLRKLVMKGTV